MEGNDDKNHQEQASLGPFINSFPRGLQYEAQEQCNTS